MPELDLAQRVWTLPKSRTKNAKAYVVRRRLFAKLTNRRLKRGVFRSVTELQIAIDRFIAETNADPKPFVWIAPPSRILAERGKQMLESLD